MVFHQLRVRVQRKEAGELAGNQQGISCNFTKTGSPLEYFTLSFDKMTFFSRAILSGLHLGEHSGHLYNN